MGEPSGLVFATSCKNLCCPAWNSAEMQMSWPRTLTRATSQKHPIGEPERNRVPNEALMLRGKPPRESKHIARHSTENGTHPYPDKQIVGSQRLLARKLQSFSKAGYERDLPGLAK